MTEFSALVSTNSVAGAYRSSQGLKVDPSAAAQDAGAGTRFSDLVRNATSDTIETIREAEAVTTAGLRGDATMQQIVEATVELESTVRIAVTMRDKLVESYQEIMRMPI